MKNNTANAVIYSDIKPTKLQEKGFLAFLKKRYGEDITLLWEYTDTIPGGFKLIVGNDIYDWSVEGRISQMKKSCQNIFAEGADVIPLISDAVSGFTPKIVAEEFGTVLSVCDGIAHIEGLVDASFGEILLFENGIRGMVQTINESGPSCILFDDDNEVYAGIKAFKTGKTAGVPVGEAFLGRVVNSLGVPIDNLGNINTPLYRNIESPAPPIIDRQPVDTPMETGILAVDALLPIGRGQRELIIGDRQTGKTAIALDAIINQKGKDVICIYVSIGQKNSSVANLTDSLKKHDALSYTIIVHASAGDSPSMQYIAPYAGCAMGEYFMEKGKDVLIIYDDLSKHAVAYRTLSLLLERAPGREAYPGDVFYLHSRLLERAAHLSDERGGGSMTAIPIVETQAGDVSAYIPTNIISITDGQIFMETGLFFSGQRPAINLGISVSRVGKDAQCKAMKKASGSLKLELAQYREMEVFSQFAGDLDDATKNRLAYGKSLMRILRQGRYKPYKLYEQVILLTVASAGLFMNIDEKEIEPLAEKLLAYFGTDQKEICNKINLSADISDEDKALIIEISKDYIDKNS